MAKDLVQVLFYDPHTLLGRAAQRCVPKVLERAHPDHDPYVFLPDDMDPMSMEPHAWKVDLEAGSLSFVGRPVEAWEVNNERDERLKKGFTYNGLTFDGSYDSIAATFAAMDSEDEPILWIGKDNSIHQFDYDTMRAFTKTAMAYKTAVFIAARHLKDMQSIPLDYKSNMYWPESV